jgi:hypothetical protein
MADIQISDLRITGSDLFDDSENYLQDLSEEEVNFQGGMIPTLVADPTTKIKTSHVHSVYYPVTTRFPD